MVPSPAWFRFEGLGSGFRVKGLGCVLRVEASEFIAQDFFQGRVRDLYAYQVLFSVRSLIADFSSRRSRS